jgi:polyphosphate glucokinase
MAQPGVLTKPRPRRPRRILVIDIGGTHVKVLATGHRTPREIPSGPAMTPRDMVAAVKRLAAK